MIRMYREKDAAALAQLFYESVHAVAAADYTPQQLEAWVTAPPEVESWAASFEGRWCLVAELDGEIVGFADMDLESGYLDRLYVHKDHQRQGIATSLCDALEAQAGGRRLTVAASLTARSFFEQRGWQVVKKQTVCRNGVRLENYWMEKLTQCQNEY